MNYMPSFSLDAFLRHVAQSFVRHAFTALCPARVRRRQDVRPQFPSMRIILMAAMMPIPGL